MTKVLIGIRPSVMLYFCSETLQSQPPPRSCIIESKLTVVALSCFPAGQLNFITAMSIKYLQQHLAGGTQV